MPSRPPERSAGALHSFDGIAAPSADGRFAAAASSVPKTGGPLETRMVTLLIEPRRSARRLPLTIRSRRHYIEDKRVD